MTANKAESPQMEDPFIYAPQPTSKVQGITQAGTRPSIHVSLYAYGGISAACMMSWVDLTATFARSDRQTDLRTIREDALISRDARNINQRSRNLRRRGVEVKEHTGILLGRQAPSPGSARW